MDIIEVNRLMVEIDKGCLDTEARQVQQLGRVAIPDEWWEDLGLESGEEVLLKKMDGHIEVHSMEKVMEEL